MPSGNVVPFGKPTPGGNRGGRYSDLGQSPSRGGEVDRTHRRAHSAPRDPRMDSRRCPRWHGHRGRYRCGHCRDRHQIRQPGTALTVCHFLDRDRASRHPRQQSAQSPDGCRIAASKTPPQAVRSLQPVRGWITHNSSFIIGMLPRGDPGRAAVAEPRRTIAVFRATIGAPS